MTIGCTIGYLVGPVPAANSSVISQSLEKGYSRLVNLLASSDMFDPRYGYCYVDLTLNTESRSENCDAAFSKIMAASEGIGVIIREEDRIHLPRIVLDVWRLVSKRN